VEADECECTDDTHTGRHFLTTDSVSDRLPSTLLEIFLLPTSLRLFACLITRVHASSLVSSPPSRICSFILPYHHPRLDLI
jgi:hypothetical protein